MRDDPTKTSAVYGHPSSFEIILLVVLLGFFPILPERAESVCNLIGSLAKPDSVTQTRCTQLRTTPTDRLAPGFDPSKLLSHSLPGEIGGTAAIDSALELIVVLGPGEITGNPSPPAIPWGRRRPSESSTERKVHIGICKNGIFPNGIFT